MFVRGRSSSDVPAEVVDTAASETGIPLGTEGEDRETIENRKSGAGALLGYDVGLGTGIAYSLARPALNGVSKPIAGLGLGLVAMAASDVPAIALGVTDPREWGVQGWISDLLPHLAYGLVTVMVMEEFRSS
jgi:hypothetical protein